MGDAWSWGLVVGWFLLPLESGLGRAEQKSKSCSRSLFLNLAIVVCPIKSRGGGRRIQGFLQQHSKLSELEASLGYRKPVSRKKKKFVLPVSLSALSGGNLTGAFSVFFDLQLACSAQRFYI